MAKGKYETAVRPKLFLVECWARDGLSDEQIAKNVGIAYSTFRVYKEKHKAFSAALEKGKEIVDYEVVNSLYQKCVGGYVTEDKAFKCKEIYYDKEGKRCEKEKVKTVKVQRFVESDTTAIAIWLNNRKPSDWKRNRGKEELDNDRFEEEKKVNEKKNF